MSGADKSLTGDMMPTATPTAYLTQTDIAANLPSDARFEMGEEGKTYLLGRFGGAVVTDTRLFVADGVSVGVTTSRLALDGGFFGTLYHTIDGRAFKLLEAAANAANDADPWTAEKEEGDEE